jgi:hypothetical protein
MKKFNFPLDRALEWRQGQARIEEGKLEQLYSEMRGIEARQAAAAAACTESQRRLLNSSTTTGLELEALDTFRRFTAAEHIRLESQRIACRPKIAAQLKAVTGKRRDVRLLERLRERRLAVWNIELYREIDAQADESYLAKWIRK